MPGQVYAVASGKGGVGKTTTVVNLGVALRVDGHSVALVDADLGMANVAEVLGIDHEPTIHDVLAGEAAVEDAVAESADGFAVVPGDRSLDAYAAADPAELDAVFQHVAGRYDVVLVDTGGGVGYEEVLPLGLVDGVVLVTTPDAAAAGDTRKTAQLVDRLGRTVTGVVVNRGGPDADGGAVADAIGAELLGVVPEDPLLTESSAAGTPVRSANPDAPSVAAFTRVAARLLGEEPEPAEGDGATAAGAGDGSTVAADAATGVGEEDTSGAPTDGETAAGDADAGGEADVDAAGSGSARAEAGSADAEADSAGGEGESAGAVDAAASGPGASDGAAGDDAASAATEAADAAETDDGSASGADAEPDRGFVTTGSGGSADAGESDSESVAETVLADDDDAASEGAAQSDESDDDEEEDSGGLFSWFR
jgi:septum site-determining protein MinD